MAISEAQRLAITKYRSEKRDQISVDVPKGKRDAYKRIAAELNLSLSMLIQNGVEGYATNHAGEVITPTPAPVPVGDKLTSEQRRLLATADNLPHDARKQLVKFLESLVTNAPASKEKDGD